MTKDEAVEKCVKAMLKQRGQSEFNWKDNPMQVDQANNIITCLEALELFKPTN
jgi:hypothetical protein